MQTHLQPLWLLKAPALALLFAFGPLQAATEGAKGKADPSALIRELTVLYDRKALAQIPKNVPEDELKRIKASPEAWVAGVKSISAPGSPNAGLDKYFAYWLGTHAQQGDPSAFLRGFWPAIRDRGDRKALLYALPGLGLALERIHFGRGFGPADKERRSQILQKARQEARQLHPRKESVTLLHFCLHHEADPQRLLEDALEYRGHSELGVLGNNPNLYGAARAMDVMIESEVDPMALPMLARLLRRACDSGRMKPEQEGRAKVRLKRMLPDLRPRDRNEVLKLLEEKSGAAAPVSTP